jgi:N-acetyl-alpha-D-glucosaminyl L-malate synthase BshA
MPAKLLLVGDGPEVGKVSKLVNKLGLHDQVLFLGRQENLEELYSISDLMLLLSEKESFGLVLLEAMACGVPCIGTNVGGVPEVIEEGRTGFICNLGDIDEIAAKAIYILSDQDLHKKFSDMAIETVKSKFQAETIVKQYEQLYFKLVDKGEIND